MALDPDAQGEGELQPLLVRQAKLTSELVDADLLRQDVLVVICRCRRRMLRLGPTILAHPFPEAACPPAHRSRE
ncbi:MAG TPA: hypothetical protein VKV36_11060 [Acidimicrobiales bacterium]|nr:hypothetical protein [Acidimicrobiales bacterium]